MSNENITSSKDEFTKESSVKESVILGISLGLPTSVIMRQGIITRNITNKIWPCL